MPLLLRAVVAAVGLALLAAAPPAAAKTVWLCKPGLEDNPCAASLDTTRFSPAGERLGVRRLRPPRRLKFDCFYVYPTVSDQPTPAANLDIDPELQSIARYQAARYTSECRMYAPVYRQITLAALNGVVTATPEMRERAYLDVRGAWRRYLRRFNNGRGVVIIGHSQGTFVLRELIANEVDRKPAVRRKLISALLLGGNLTVRRGRDAGGDFRRIKACRSRRQVGCVVAFATYGEPPPPDARFGRTTEPGLEVLCTNPGALGGGSRNLDPIVPSEPFAPGTTIGAVTPLIGYPDRAVRTAWIAAPSSYGARCSSAGGANVLLIGARGGAPTLRAIPDARWGLHLTDANIALGNLVRLVRTQAAAWRRKR